MVWFERTRNIGLDFFLSDFNLFVSLRHRAVTATVLKHFFSCSEEAWMTMKINLSIVLLVPFGIEKKVFGIQQSVDSSGIVLLAYRG